MELFKNEMGELPNETPKTRKILYLIIAIVVISMLGAGAFFITKYFGVTGESKNVTVSICRMPYNRNNCGSAKNATVKAIQKMLKKKKFYSGSIDGNFGNSTFEAVKKFQKNQKITQDGHVGPDTLSRLAKATGTSYYDITYNSKGGSGSLNYSNGQYTGSWNNRQIILKGISTSITIGKYTKSGYKQVGFVDAKGKFYDFGQKVSKFSSKKVTLYALYCKSNESYKNGKCVGSYSLAIKYNTNGGAVTKNVTYDNTKYVWTTDTNGNIYVSVNGSKSSDIIQKKGEADKVNLSNYNNDKFLNIFRTGYTAKSGEEWYCYSGKCSGKTFNQAKNYDIKEFCEITKNDCTVSLRVNWTPNTYTVTYNGNGGKYNGSSTWTDPNKAVYDKNYKTRSNDSLFVKEGDKFVGWNTKADGTGTDWTDRINKDWKWTNAKDVTLYARWASQPVPTVTAKFEINGASSIGKTNISCNKNCSVKAPSITAKSGFEVLGWAMSPNSKTAAYKVGQTINLTKNVTYYAITKSKQKNEVFFNYDRKQVSKISSTSASCYRYNGSSSCTIALPTVTPVSGYKSEGWSEQNKGSLSSNNIIKANYKASSAKTYLYLVLSKIVSLSFDKNIADSISATSAKCTNYIVNGSSNGCKFDVSKLPRIYSTGSEIAGLSNSYNGSVTPISGNKYNSNLKLYAILGPSNRKIQVSKSIKIKDIAFEIENTSKLKSSVVNKLIVNSKDVAEKMPFLFDARTKVRMISKNTYTKKLWDEKSAGMTYTWYEEYSNIDINIPENYYEYYTAAIVHELGHAWDAWYGVSTGTKISSQSDVSALFNEYSKKPSNKRPLRDYAYTNKFEFVAEMTSFYYYYKYKTSVPNPEGGNAINEFDNRLVNLFEKYVNKSLNGYK